MVKENSKKYKILEILEEETQMPTSKIAFKLSLNYYQAEHYLDELYDLNYINKITKGKSTYWELNNDKEKNVGQ